MERLLAMVRSHSLLLSEVAGKPPVPIENWVAWPIHCRFGDNELRNYGQEATLKDLPPPPDLDVAAMEHGYGRPQLKDFATKPKT